jgi:hypothetical protein
MLDYRTSGVLASFSNLKVMFAEAHIGCIAYVIARAGRSWHPQPWPTCQECASGAWELSSTVVDRRALSFPLSGIYAASKNPVETMTEVRSLEVGHLGVSVSVIQAPSVLSQLGANGRTTPRLDDYHTIADGQRRATCSARPVP